MEASQRSFPIDWFVEGAWRSCELLGLVVPFRNDSNFSGLPRNPNERGAISGHLYRTTDLTSKDLMTIIGRNCAGWLDNRLVGGSERNSAARESLPNIPSTGRR